MPTEYLVPAGQDGLTVPVAPDAPAVVRWPHAMPVRVRLAASQGAVRYGFRVSAAERQPGVSMVAAEQTVTANVSAEYTPLVLHLQSDGPAQVTVTGYRQPGVLISAPSPDLPARAGQGSPGRGVVSIALTSDGWLRFRMSDGTDEYARIPAPGAPADPMDDMPSLSVGFENGLM